MKKKILFFLFLASISTSIFSATYWISRFFVSINFTNTGPIAVLNNLNESEATCDCNIHTITTGYSSFTISNPTKNLFIGEWIVHSQDPTNIKVDILRSNIENTTAVIGIGYFSDTCDYGFEDLTNISLDYDNKKLCILTYSFGKYEDKYFYDITDKRIVVFLWIPSVGDNTTISLKSGVYIV